MHLLAISDKRRDKKITTHDGVYGNKKRQQSTARSELLLVTEWPCERIFNYSCYTSNDLHMSPLNRSVTQQHSALDSPSRYRFEECICRLPSLNHCFALLHFLHFCRPRRSLRDIDLRHKLCWPFLRNYCIIFLWHFFYSSFALVSTKNAKQFASFSQLHINW